ncbi:Hypothetical protein NTJ_15553 [Nesidiocoris tenuis]|uniref:Uncharacterized protein n=1 Tax=Nesidiocoris tenuis TaxID=355587 RepID=A0ABN7BEE0_9HEMI|nr:Hypothetical protein NTJ_15553 [Nesidiocoris tenuis]
MRIEESLGVAWPPGKNCVRAEGPGKLKARPIRDFSQRPTRFSVLRLVVVGLGKSAEIRDVVATSWDITNGLNQAWRTLPLPAAPVFALGREPELRRAALVGRAADLGAARGPGLPPVR